MTESSPICFHLTSTLQYTNKGEADWVARKIYAGCYDEVLEIINAPED